MQGTIDIHLLDISPIFGRIYYNLSDVSYGGKCVGREFKYSLVIL